MNSRIVIMLGIISVFVNGCFFNLAMDRIKYYNIHGAKDFIYNTNCGKIEMSIKSSLERDVYNLRMKIGQGMDSFYPQQLNLIDSDGRPVSYELWRADDQITEQEIDVTDGYLASYYFETKGIKGIRFMADSLVSRKGIFCSVDTLAIRE